MFRSNIFLKTTMVAAIVAVTGCSKLVEIDPPVNETSAALVYKSDRTAKAAVSGLYSTLSQSLSQNTGLTIYNAVAADEMQYLGVASPYTDLYANEQDPTLTSASNSFFTDFYAAIYKANSIIEGLTTIEGTSAAVKKQLLAETRFLRAYSFFYLVNIFGDVPLVTMTDPNVSAYLPRTAAADVYKIIISDLIQARDDLGTDYSTSSGSRLAPNKYAAAALLARVYLFTGNYEAAIENATLVLDNKTLYNLIPTASIGTGVFVKDSKETIFQFGPALSANNVYVAETGTLLPASYTAASITFKLQPALWAQFAANDARRKWVKDTVVGGQSYQFAFKYKYRTNALAVAAGVTEYPVVLRLSEQYLIRAEARARSAKSGAADDLNVVRSRAGLSAITSADNTVLLDEIGKENRREFFCELGHRWFTLKRTGEIDAVMKALKPSSWQSTDALYPIPQASRDANPNLTQNLGYRN
ncbi:RagB/SusD family nutrient uptake outer membrane protein [Filimonas effusa]|uniref:RagB/SusD family nutrient uptake outer membrane protein n=1 Tax=Filimonas effusa TaxID=2508721 RepID=A0A4Q1D3W5_9BACT|nr:RagB/SusD family nutrient uptake outer membrane protein [Filimonas effusa]RXK83110.1 RagB/SusD family nutrient uptake outer membrane protein [Filimonas effusa]